MSRIGRKPILLPTSVKVAVAGQEVRVEGPKGKLSHTVPDVLTVEVKDGQLQVGRTADHRRARALHGLTRSLLANIVQGVSQGFEKKLEIVGIGQPAPTHGKTPP